MGDVERSFYCMAGTKRNIGPTYIPSVVSYVAQKKQLNNTGKYGGVLSPVIYPLPDPIQLLSNY